MGNKNLNKICFDTSCIVKLLIPERDSSNADRLYKQTIISQVQIVIPHFSKVELYSTVRKKVALREINHKAGQKALKLFKALEISYIKEDNKLLEESFDLSKKLDLTVTYDCLFLVLAQRENAAFITADEKFIKKAKKVFRRSFTLKEGLKMLKT